MRLLITTDTIGGVWTFTQELSFQLIAAGCAINLVSLGRLPSQAQKEWSRYMQHEWPEIFRYDALDVPLEWMPQNESAFCGAADRLMQLAAEFGAQLLHSNQFCFGALPVSIPRAVTAHSDVYSWARACRTMPLKISPWLDRYTSMVSRGLAEADRVIAPTQWMAESLLRDFPLPRTPLVIPNGRSLPPAGSTQRKLQAITAGRLWDEGKNISILAHVRAPFPVLVAGETSLADTGAPEFLGDTRLLGPLGPEELLALFRESALYICTSRYEPFGLAPLEAALSGCAILANDIPSLREVWDDGALYFSSPENLTVLLHQLHADPELLESARETSLRRARLFSAERMGSSYFSLFHELLSAEAPA